MESFQQCRLSNAYERFVQVTNAGQAPAARAALSICEQVSVLVGKDRDSGPDEVGDWASMARVPVPAIGPPEYPFTAPRSDAGGKGVPQSAHRRIERVVR